MADASILKRIMEKIVRAEGPALSKAEQEVAEDFLRMNPSLAKEAEQKAAKLIKPKSAQESAEVLKQATEPNFLLGEAQDIRMTPKRGTNVPAVRSEALPPSTIDVTPSSMTSSAVPPKSSFRPGLKTGIAAGTAAGLAGLS